MKHILLLEDDESLNRGISLKLSKEGYHVFSAGTISEANSIFSKESIDLVISDITLPDGNGLDFGKVVREKSNAVIVLAGIYLLLTSANKQKLTEAENDLNFVYEQLLSFQNENMDILPLPEESSSQKFGEVYDKLRELGYYFSDLKERLAQEENSTKALITDISHQLKTPLASIKMSHELSLSSDLSEEERKSFLETETQEILKMEVLLDELVKLSRLENSMIQITCEKCSIKKTISEAVSQIYIKANAKDIEICVDMKKDVETPHDHKWTVEALANILENAVKYSASGTGL